MKARTIVNIANQTCPTCNKKTNVFDENTGEILCSSCGYVFSEKIEDCVEQRTFTEENRARVGDQVKITFHDKGLATIIGQRNQDAFGKPLSAYMKNSFERLRIWDGRSQAFSSSDKSLRTALLEINNLKEKLALSDTITESSAYLYRKVSERNLTRGRSIKALAGACVYASCRNTETNRTLEDISNAINVRKKELAKCYRVLFREFDLKVPIPDPQRSIVRISGTIGLSERTKRKAVEILNEAKKNGFVAGKDPMGLAAAILYIAGTHYGDVKSQRQLAEAAGTSEVTIRNGIKGLKKSLDSKLVQMI